VDGPSAAATTRPQAAQAAAPAAGDTAGASRASNTFISDGVMYLSADPTCTVTDADVRRVYKHNNISRKGVTFQMARVNVSIAKVYNAVLQEKKALDDSRQQEIAPSSMSLCQVRTPALKGSVVAHVADKAAAKATWSLSCRWPCCTLRAGPLPASVLHRAPYGTKACPVASSALHAQPLETAGEAWAGQRCHFRQESVAYSLCTTCNDSACMPQFRRESQALDSIVAQLFPERAHEDAGKLRVSLSRQLGKYIGPIAGEANNAGMIAGVQSVPKCEFSDHNITLLSMSDRADQNVWCCWWARANIMCVYAQPPTVTDACCCPCRVL
jgi:hypothetical protein